jgi:clan AA aspartic protease
MRQESGRVNARREAIISIRFLGGDSQDCVVDTGFDGALILPTAVVKGLGLPVIARLGFELVGGARMTADVALGEVEWLGEHQSVEVIISDGNDALVGAEMLESAKLVVDYTDGMVTILRDRKDHSPV